MKNLISKLFLITITLISAISFASEKVPFELAKNYFVKNTYLDQSLHSIKLHQVIISLKFLVWQL